MFAMLDGIARCEFLEWRKGFDLDKSAVGVNLHVRVHVRIRRVLDRTKSLDERQIFPFIAGPSLTVQNADLLLRVYAFVNSKADRVFLKFPARIGEIRVWPKGHRAYRQKRFRAVRFERLVWNNYLAAGPHYRQRPRRDLDLVAAVCDLVI